MIKHIKTLWICQVLCARISNSIEDPRCWYGLGEGMGTRNGLSYESRSNKDDLQRRISEYLKIHGYILSEYGYPDYTNGSKFLRVEIEEQAQGKIQIIAEQHLY